MPTTYAIPNGAQYMAATTYTGTAANGNVIVNAGGFQPDLVWAKGRSMNSNHNLVDSVRGTTKYLYSSLTDAEGTWTDKLVSFNSNGFTLNSDQIGTGQMNSTNGGTYVAWQWKAGQGTTSSNTSGSITSTVSVNATAGFSIVTYTGTGSGSITVGHGLGVTPAMWIIKDRTLASTDWLIGHQSLPSNYYLLFQTNAQSNVSTPFVSQSSTTLGLQGSQNLAQNYVAYCWAAVAGYSAFGSYTGNGSSDGAFIYCGFRPRFILHKASSTTSQWMIWDTARNTYNVLTNAELLANSSAAEGSGAWGTEIDILSNGFKFRGSDNSNFNYTGVTYIYAAFAENPFKYANAR